MRLRTKAKNVGTSQQLLKRSAPESCLREKKLSSFRLRFRRVFKLLTGAFAAIANVRAKKAAFVFLFVVCGLCALTQISSVSPLSLWAVASTMDDDAFYEAVFYDDTLQMTDSGNGKLIGSDKVAVLMCANDELLHSAYAQIHALIEMNSRHSSASQFSLTFHICHVDEISNVSLVSSILSESFAAIHRLNANSRIQVHIHDISEALGDWLQTADTAFFKSFFCKPICLSLIGGSAQIAPGILEKIQTVSVATHNQFDDGAANQQWNGVTESDHFLLLDADILLMHCPLATVLRRSKEYRQRGYLLFRDQLNGDGWDLRRWLQRKVLPQLDNDVNDNAKTVVSEWIESNVDTDWIGETALVVFSRESLQSLVAFVRVLYSDEWRDSVHSHVYGDKETWWLSLLMRGTAPQFNRWPMAVAGTVQSDRRSMIRHFGQQFADEHSNSYQSGKVCANFVTGNTLMQFVTATFMDDGASNSKRKKREVSKPVLLYINGDSIESAIGGDLTKFARITHLCGVSIATGTVASGVHFQGTCRELSDCVCIEEANSGLRPAVFGRIQHLQSLSQEFRVLFAKHKLAQLKQKFAGNRPVIAHYVSDFLNITEQLIQRMPQRTTMEKRQFLEL